MPRAVYFDTNILRGAGWPKGNAQLLQVINHAEWLSIQLCLPDVVRRELEGHWIRTVEKNWQDANSQTAALTKTLKPLLSIAKLPELPDEPQLMEHFYKDAQPAIKQFVSVATTTRPVSDFVKMAILRQATFDDQGNGFRDAVILCSILEHAETHGFVSAVLVSEDGDFQRPGVSNLLSSLGFDFRVIKKLDELETLLKKNKNAAFREYLEAERSQMLDALNDKSEEIEAFLVANLSVSARDLGVWNKIRKVESLRLLSIENAHTGFDFLSTKRAGPSRVRISADVKVEVILDMEQYAPPPEERFKVGGQIVPSPEPTSDWAALISEQMARVREGMAVVEAEATRTQDKYSDIVFTGAYWKPSGGGLAAWAGLGRT